MSSAGLGRDLILVISWAAAAPGAGGGGERGREEEGIYCFMREAQLTLPSQGL